MATRSNSTGRDWPSASRGAARRISFAAAPTFVVMAMLNGLTVDPSAGICSAAGGLAHLSGMTAMYALMAAFHLGPWLRLPACGRADLHDRQGQSS